MCRLRNIVMRDYQESVNTGQTHTHTKQRYAYVPLFFAGYTKRVTLCRCLDGHVKGEVNRFFNVIINDILVIHVTAHGYRRTEEFEFIGVLRHMQRYFSQICDGSDVQAD